MAQRYHYRRWRRRRAGASRASHGRWRLLILAPLIALPLFVALGAASIYAYYVQASASMVPPDQAIAAQGGGARIYDRNGVELYQFLGDRVGLQYPVKLDDVSPWLQQATIATEDASFYSNPGINLKGLAHAVLTNLRPGDFLEGPGGSSITQQLVKLLYFTPEQRDQRSFTRKLREAAYAVRLTQDYDKRQILEWYLNEIPYGGVFTGVEAASEGYFGVSALDLTLGQAAFLAGLPQSPAEYDPFTHFDAATGRQHQVLDLMARSGFISQQLADLAKFERIELHPQQRPNLAPHFVQYVADYIKSTLGEGALYHGGLDVRTTLDLSLNLRANAYLEQHIAQYEKTTNAHNGSVIVMEPKTGEILAMVGSRNYNGTDIDGQVNNALGLRSPGSTLKPFTYATAFMQGWGPDWPIVDSPIVYKQADGKDFIPRNPDGRTRGVMPLKEAFGNSFNIPAFKTILWVGVDNMVKTAKSMGITTLDGQLGPAVTLGGSDVKLLDMVYAYSTLANEGTMVGAPTTASLPAGNRKLDPLPVLTVKNQHGEVLLDNTHPQHVDVMRPEYAYMITDILQNDADRQITYGPNSLLNIPGWRVAVKTGTSEPYEGQKWVGDTWTFGYTPDVAVGVWIGNSDNTPTYGIFSTTIAGATWHDVMADLLKGRTAVDFVRPPGIVKATVCVPSGIVRQAGMVCPSVTGMFAADALARQDSHWWGGREVAEDTTRATSDFRVPPEITGWKRYLAQEYLRWYSGYGAGSNGTPQPQTTAVPAPPAPPVTPQSPGRGRGRKH